MADDSIRILVVEDDEGVREIYGELLRMEGFEVSEAGSGEQALHLLGERTHHFVFSDLRMPRSSGLDVLKGSRLLDPPPYVFLITAYSDISEDEVYALGGAGLLCKPFDPRRLAKIARQFVQGPPESWLRRRPRRLCNFPVEIESAGKSRDLRVLNAGEAGIFVADTEIVCFEGDSINFALQPPEAGIIGGRAVVRWVREDAVGELARGYGLQIVEFTAGESGREAWLTYLNRIYPH